MKQRICIFRNIKEGIFHKHQYETRTYFFLNLKNIYNIPKFIKKISKCNLTHHEAKNMYFSEH